MDSIVEKTYAIEQLDSIETALEYIEKFINDGYQERQIIENLR